MTLDEIYHALDPVAFSVGPFAVRWYGLAYLAGFVCVGLAMSRNARRWRLDITGDEILEIVLSVAIGIILGARFGYVLFYGAGYYLAHPLSILAINEGGMSFHGGVVGALVGGYIACRVRSLNFRTMCDLAICGVPFGLFFGRCANFINGELWGKQTDLPWGVVFETGGDVARHPSQLYEALLEGLVILVVLAILSGRSSNDKPLSQDGKPLPQGTFAGTFFLLYGIFRFLIEFVRVPDAQLGYLAGWLTMGQVLSLPLIVLGITELVLARKRQWPQEARSR